MSPRPLSACAWRLSWLGALHSYPTDPSKDRVARLKTLFDGKVPSRDNPNDPDIELKDDGFSQITVSPIETVSIDIGLMAWAI